MILGPDGKPARQNGTGGALETPEWMKRETFKLLRPAFGDLERIDAAGRVLALRESVEAETPARKISRSDLCGS